MTIFYCQNFVLQVYWNMFEHVFPRDWSDAYIWIPFKIDFYSFILSLLFDYLTSLFIWTFIVLLLHICLVITIYMSIFNLIFMKEYKLNFQRKISSLISSKVKNVKLMKYTMNSIAVCHKCKVFVMSPLANDNGALYDFKRIALVLISISLDNGSGTK